MPGILDYIAQAIADDIRAVTQTADAVETGMPLPPSTAPLPGEVQSRNVDAGYGNILRVEANNPVRAFSLNFEEPRTITVYVALQPTTVQGTTPATLRAVLEYGVGRAKQRKVLDVGARGLAITVCVSSLTLTLRVPDDEVGAGATSDAIAWWGYGDAAIVAPNPTYTPYTVNVAAGGLLQFGYQGAIFDTDVGRLGLPNHLLPPGAFEVTVATDSTEVWEIWLVTAVGPSVSVVVIPQPAGTRIATVPIGGGVISVRVNNTGVAAHNFTLVFGIIV